MNNKPQTGRKYLQNIYISDKGLVSKIYKRTLKLNNEKKKTFTIWAKDLSRYPTKEKIQMSNKHIKRYSILYVLRKL